MKIEDIQKRVRIWRQLYNDGKHENLIEACNIIDEFITKTTSFYSEEYFEKDLEYQYIPCVKCGITMMIFKGDPIGDFKLCDCCKDYAHDSNSM